MKIFNFLGTYHLTAFDIIVLYVYEIYAENGFLGHRIINGHIRLCPHEYGSYIDPKIKVWVHLFNSYQDISRRKDFWNEEKKGDGEKHEDGRETEEEKCKEIREKERGENRKQRRQNKRGNKKDGFPPLPLARWYWPTALIMDLWPYFVHGDWWEGRGKNERGMKWWEEKEIVRVSESGYKFEVEIGNIK